MTNVNKVNRSCFYYSSEIERTNKYPIQNKPAQHINELTMFVDMLVVWHDPTICWRFKLFAWSIFGCASLIAKQWRVSCFLGLRSFIVFYGKHRILDFSHDPSKCLMFFFTTNTHLSVRMMRETWCVDILAWSSSLLMSFHTNHFLMCYLCRTIHFFWGVDIFRMILYEFFDVLLFSYDSVEFSKTYLINIYKDVMCSNDTYACRMIIKKETIACRLCNATLLSIVLRHVTEYAYMFCLDAFFANQEEQSRKLMLIWTI